MKTYKLKKDLPLAKNGEEVEIYEKGQNLVRIYKKPNNNRSGILICQIKKENISEWLEEIPQKPKSIWDLKEGDDFYFIFNNSVRKNFITNYEPFRVLYLEEGNAFLTKEKAEKELEKRKAIQRIKKYCWENNIDTSWKGGKKRYYIPVEIDGDIKIDHGQEYKTASYIGYFYDWNTLHFLIQEFKNDLKIIFNV